MLGFDYWLLLIRNKILRYLEDWLATLGSLVELVGKLDILNWGPRRRPPLLEVTRYVVGRRGAIRRATEFIIVSLELLVRLCHRLERVLVQWRFPLIGVVSLLILGGRSLVNMAFIAGQFLQHFNFHFRVVLRCQCHFILFGG